MIGPAPQRDSEPGTCPSCGRHGTWESLVDAHGERWLAVCRCGRLRAYLPGQPELDPEDPLSAFLLGPRVPIFPASPPWVRVFLASVEGPNPVRWRFCHEACRTCGTSASFGFQACPRTDVFAICTLCLVCGNATACYSKPGRAVFEGAAVGRTWTPPSVAVQRLRDCLHHPYSLLRVDGWCVSTLQRLRRSVITTERAFWYQRTWGLWAIGVSVALVTVLAGYAVQRLGGGALGALISFFGVTVLSWAVPVAIAHDARPRRPAQVWRDEKVWWGRGAWRTRGRGYYWEYMPERNEWRRRGKIPLMSDTRDATRALIQQELLREQNRLLEDQNRLLAGLPPLPREEVPIVIEGTPSGGSARTNPGRGETRG